MNSNPHNDHLSVECLSEKQMLDYIDNKLTAKERHTVERHVLDCELCTDALEGFSLITDRSKLDDAAFAVNRLVLESDPVKEEKRGWWSAPMKVAASAAAILLIGSIAFYVKNNIEKEAEQTFAEHFEPFPAGKDNEAAAEKNEDNLDLQEKETAKTEASIESLVQTKNSGDSKQEIVTTAGPVLADKRDINEKPSSPSLVTLSKQATGESTMMDEETVALKDMDIAPQEESNGATDANSVAGNITMSGNSYYRSNDSSAILKNSAAAPAQTQEVTSYTSSGTGAGYNYSEVTKTLAKKDNIFAQNSSNSKKRSKSMETSPATLTATDKADDSKAKEKAAGTEQRNDALNKERSEMAKLEEEQKTSLGKLALDKAMEKYKAGKHAEAVPLFEQALASDPQDTEALFYSAVSYLSISQPDKALANLNKVLAQNNSAYNDPATWYKALAYIKKGDKNSARLLLEQLQKGSSTYKQKAADMLKDLD